MANRNNQVGRTEAGTQFATVHLVTDLHGNYRTTDNLGTLQPGESNVARATCWKGSANSADDAAQVLLDRVNAGGSFS